MAYENENLGHELKEVYLVSRTGYATLVVVSKGLDGGPVFNIGSMEVGPVLKDVHRKISGRLYHGGKLVDSDGNEMTIQELFDFVAYMRGREPTTDGLQGKITIDSHGFAFGVFKPRFLRNITR